MTMTTKRAIDVSNYQMHDLTPLLDYYKPDKVIVRLNMPWEKIPVGIDRKQINSVKAYGLPVEGYAWAYGSINPSLTGQQIAYLIGILGLQFVWLDCEDQKDPIDEAWLHEFENELVTQGIVGKVGIYTSKRWWEQHFTFSHDDYFPQLWDANDKFDPDSWAGFVSYGGWTTPTMVQFSYTDIDLNAYQEQETEEVATQPVPDPLPTTPDAPVLRTVPAIVDDIYQVAEQLLSQDKASDTAVTLFKAVQDLKNLFWRYPQSY